MVTAAARFLLGFEIPEDGEAGGRCVGFDRHDTYAALSAGKKDGVSVCERPGSAGEVRLISAPEAPHTATDGLGFYNGDRYHWGSLTSPIYGTATRFDALVPSWNAKTPAGTWVELEVRVRPGDAWTGWLNMGVWASGTESVRRHSVNGQRAGNWRVLTDTLKSTGPIFADAYQYRLKLFTAKWGISPKVSGVFVAVWDSYRHEDDPAGTADAGLWSRELAVPARSQMVYPDGGEAWCSPASLSMSMAYWAAESGREKLDQPVPTVARGTYDYVYEGNGNWSFNAAYASSLGLKASVNRFGSLEQVERWVASGVPVVASVAWKKGQLSGAPIPGSDGHLVVIRGFDCSGDVIVNDPAGRDCAQVCRVYRRDEFARAWTGSGNIVYLVYPYGWSTPDPADARGGW